MSKLDYIGRAIVIALTGCLMAVPVSAHEEHPNGCEPARFVEMENAYRGTLTHEAIRDPNDETIILEWKAVQWIGPNGETYWFDTDNIMLLKAFQDPATVTDYEVIATTYEGVMIVTDLYDQKYLDVTDPETGNRHLLEHHFFFLEGATLDDVVHRVQCRHDAVSPDPEPPMTHDEQERAEARQWQIRQALEKLSPQDLF